MAKPFNPKILVAIPALNESPTLPSVIKDIREIFSGLNYEILVVDDGSSDDTSSIASKSGCHVIGHAKTLGVGMAFRSATEFAKKEHYSGMATIDADGQFNAKDLLRLVHEAQNNESIDLVSGTRFESGHGARRVPFIKRQGNKLIASLVSKLVGQKISDSACGLRYYTQEALRFVHLRGRFTYTQETLMDVAFRGLTIRQIPIDVEYFNGRQSRVAGNLFTYGTKAISIIAKAARDYFPMKIFGSFSLVTGLVAILFSSIFLVQFFLSGVFSGFLFAGLLGAFFSLISIVSLGVGLIIDSLCDIRLSIAKNDRRD